MNLTAIRLFLRSFWKRNVLVIIVALAIGISSFSDQSQSWVGQWQFTPSTTTPSTVPPITFILTPDQKAYVFASDRNVLIEMPIEELSNDATLPENIEVVSWSSYLEDTANPPAPTGESQAQIYLAAMNRSQQAYRIENPRFASDMASLEIGLPSETSDYRYQVVPQSDDTRSVMMTARALKPELRSYTGAVFVTSQGTTSTIVCVSNQPSTTPPAMPTAPTNGNAQPQCAPNSSALR